MPRVDKVLRVIAPKNTAVQNILLCNKYRSLINKLTVANKRWWEEDILTSVSSHCQTKG